MRLNISQTGLCILNDEQYSSIAFHNPFKRTFLEDPGNIILNYINLWISMGVYQNWNQLKHRELPKQNFDVLKQARTIAKQANEAGPCSYVEISCDHDLTLFKMQSFNFMVNLNLKQSSHQNCRIVLNFSTLFFPNDMHTVVSIQSKLDIQSSWSPCIAHFVT